MSQIHTKRKNTDLKFLSLGKRIMSAFCSLYYVTFCHFSKLVYKHDLQQSLTMANFDESSHFTGGWGRGAVGGGPYLKRSRIILDNNYIGLLFRNYASKKRGE